MYTVVLPLAGTETGLEDAEAETPLGNSFTLNVTDPLNPFTLVTVSVVYSVVPLMRMNDDGDDDRVKFLVPEEAFTVNAMVVL